MNCSQVKKVLDKRISEKGSPEYLVEWHSSTTPRWEPITNLKNELEALADFEVEIEQKTKKSLNPRGSQEKTGKKKVMTKQMAGTSEEEEYEVEEIINKKMIKGVMNYQVKWKGYPLSDSTWEPLKNLLNAKKAVTVFEEKQKRLIGENEEEKQENEKPLEKIEKKKKMKQIKQIPLMQEEEEIIEPVMNSEQNIINNEDDKFQLEIEECPELTEKGHFKTDEADKIIAARPTKDVLLMTVSWKPRKNGIVPKESQFTNKEIFGYNPKLLVDFYEGKLRFVSQQKSKNKEDKQKHIGRILDNET